MGKDFVPIHIKSGVRKTFEGRNEQGTEVVLKYFEEVSRKGFLSTKSVKEEKQTTVFFPKVSIDNIDYVKEIYYFIDGERVMEAAPGIRTDECEETRSPSAFIATLGWIFRKGVYDDLWNRSEWRNVVKIDETTGEVWVRGEGDEGGFFLAKFYCPDLCNRVKCVREELLQQARLRAFEEHKEELEHLEKVGRYEEAAQIYEALDMPEKAGEMRRKKREAKVVQLDLNQLIRQLGERGFTITYHCSHCGAPLMIDAETEVGAIKFCRHCGSRIEPIELARFIKSYLS